MFGLGGWEIAILGMALLVFFGPKKLPQLMRQAGKVMREVRKASFEFQSSLEREMDDDAYRKQHRRDKKRKQKATELGVSPDALDPTPAPAPAPAPEPPDGNGGSAPSTEPPSATNGNGNGSGAAAPPVNGSAASEPATPPAPPEADKPKAGAG